jgi:hypothetical protein
MPPDLVVSQLEIARVAPEPCAPGVFVEITNIGTSPAPLPVDVGLEIRADDENGPTIASQVVELAGIQTSHISSSLAHPGPTYKFGQLVPGQAVSHQYVVPIFEEAADANRIGFTRGAVVATADYFQHTPGNLRTNPSRTIQVASLGLWPLLGPSGISFDPTPLPPGETLVVWALLVNVGCAPTPPFVTDVVLGSRGHVVLRWQGQEVERISQSIPPLPPHDWHGFEFDVTMPSLPAGTDIEVTVEADTTGVVDARRFPIRSAPSFIRVGP